ncbi:MAG: tetratricopeptide repeat protein [Caldimonas sp.]
MLPRSSRKAPPFAAHRLAPVALAAACALSACSMFRSGTPDNEPTLKTLAGRKMSVDKEDVVAVNETKAIEAYRKFLDIAPAAPQRSEAMRRIGDLEMDSADSASIGASAASAAAPDYKAAVARYQDYLKTYPADPNNDRVLYQMARAYEQSGDIEAALKTLDRLVKDYPATRYASEAQFRRGEFQFTAKNYAAAEKAFATVMAAPDASPYQDRSLYMMGWSQYKQGRLDDGLRSFFGVLDLKVAGRAGEPGSLDSVSGLSRADHELVEDTFRVVSISLANLQGAESIPAFITTPARKTYEFRVYEQLADLYMKQERPKDAADTFNLYARRNPLSAQAPLLQARVIEIYERTNFANLAIEARKEYVARYGRKSEFRQVNAEGWEKAQPLVKKRLTELARHYHAMAQKSKSSADSQEAVRWYRELLASFPSDPAAAQNNFLLAELLFEDGRFAEATVEYEKTAYDYARHDKSAEAGYGALLAHAQLLKKAAPADQPTAQRAIVASALRFAQAFAGDARVGAVLTDAAEKLYALKETDQATQVAQRVVDLNPPAAEAQRRVAWTVLAYTSFDKSAFAGAEKAFAEAIKLTPEKDPARADLVERQAAAIYKQAEQARASGKQKEAAASFARVGTVAPGSSVRANAQYDAAAALISLKDWDGAIKTLEDFRTRFPNHALQPEVSKKLAVAYLEKGQWAGAAGEFEKIAASNKDPKIARDALWQAAELYDKAGQKPASARVYERYLQQFPQPLESAVEARYRLATIAKDSGNAAREATLMRDIFLADQAGGAARTDRTRYLAATAALAMAEPVAEAYRRIDLVEPLQVRLKLKKAKMEEALKAYSVAADYGVADVTTAATYRIATVYRDFGKALMASERPKKLSKAELEQYNVLLEEQAYPFEEKATELHELNARRAAVGVYDKWVKSSFDALRELRPVRYGKTEVSEGVVDAIR